MPSWLWSSLQALPVSLVVAFIMARMLGPALASFFGQKAKDLATKRDIEDIVDAASKKAYGQEVAKIRADHNELDNVLSQLKQVTTLAENIKTEVSEKYWFRQMRWTQKRDTYLKVVQALADQKSTYQGFQDTLVRAMRESDSDDKNEISVSIANLKSEMEKAVAEIRGSVAVASLFIGDRTAAILNDLVNSLESPDFRAHHNLSDKKAIELSVHAIKVLDTGLTDLVSAAKADLEFD